MRFSVFVIIATIVGGVQVAATPAQVKRADCHVPRTSHSCQLFFVLHSLFSFYPGCLLALAPMLLDCADAAFMEGASTFEISNLNLIGNFIYLPPFFFQKKQRRHHRRWQLPCCRNWRFFQPGESPPRVMRVTLGVLTDRHQI